ncbi:MAG: oligosaccharide flippase family protein, partial [Thermodesulfovibrionales bacterium]
GFWFLYVARPIYMALLLGVYLVKFRRTHPVGVKTGTLSFRRLFRYGGFTFVNEIGSSILNESTDYFIIAAFLGPAAVGLYAFATRILKMFTHALPTNIFQRLVHPVFFLRFAENKDYGELSRMFNLLAKFNAFLCIPFCVGVFTLGDKMIVHLFDEKYLESFTAMRIIVLFVAVNTLFTSVGLVIKSIERVEVLLKSKVFSLYNLAGDILVAPAYGITGVAVVTGSAVLFKELYCFYYARKYTGLAIDWRGVAAILANSLLMGALVYPMRALVTGLATFAAAVVAGVCVYGLLSRLNRPFTRDERGTINSLLPAPLFPF